jgi:hypothetical protein
MPQRGRFQQVDNAHVTPPGGIVKLTAERQNSSHAEDISSPHGLKIPHFWARNAREMTFTPTPHSYFPSKTINLTMPAGFPDSCVTLVYP